MRFFTIRNERCYSNIDKNGLYRSSSRSHFFTKKRRIDPVFSSISMGLVGGGGGWQKKRARFYVQGFSFFVELPINTTMEKTIYDFSCHVFRRVARSFSKKKQFFLFKTRKSGRRRKKRMHQPNGKRMRPSKTKSYPFVQRCLVIFDSFHPRPNDLSVQLTWASALVQNV